MRMKKAQAEQFIGIAILVIALIGFVVYTKISGVQRAASTTVSISSEFKKEAVLISISSVPYITINMIPLDQLWGAYSCTGNDTIDYGSFRINVSSETNKKMDYLFGKGNWKIDLNGPKVLSMHTGYIASENQQVYDFLFSIPCDNTTIGRGKIYAK